MVEYSLKLPLCKATPASTNYKPILKWVEKQHKGNSAILCPQCAKGTWVMHGPTEWAMGEIGCDHQQVTSHGNQWIKDGSALMSEKIKEVKKERIRNVLRIFRYVHRGLRNRLCLQSWLLSNISGRVLD
jgi:hypothetical protein